MRQNDYVKTILQTFAVNMGLALIYIIFKSMYLFYGSHWKIIDYILDKVRENAKKRSFLDIKKKNVWRLPSKNDSINANSDQIAFCSAQKMYMGLKEFFGQSLHIANYVGIFFCIMSKNLICFPCIYFLNLFCGEGEISDPKVL